MISEKQLLTAEDIEAQSAIELPSRETLALVNVFVTNVLNNNTVQVPISAAANICGVSVAALTTLLASGPVTCTARSGNFVVSP
jgi:hypothetical protein